MKMGEIATCGTIIIKVGIIMMYIHCYEGDKFSIHVCDQATTCIPLYI
jgi:hypothetical protein